MGSLGLYGRQLGRRQTGVNTLVFTAMVMCLVNPAWLAAAIGKRLPLFGAQLDGILVARPAGLSQLVRQYSPAWAIWLGSETGGQAWLELDAALDEVGASKGAGLTGQSIDLGDGVELQVLEGGGPGTAIMLTWQRFAALVVLDGARSPSGLPVPGILLYQPGLENQARVWHPVLIGPGLVILLDGGAGPAGVGEFENYQVIYPPAGGWLRVTSDGQQLWLEQGR